MKKFILIFLIFGFLVACNCETTRDMPKPGPKYEIGDIVYLKPDSVKATIYQFGNRTKPTFAVRYTNKLGEVISANENGRTVYFSTKDIYQ